MVDYLAAILSWGINVSYQDLECLTDNIYFESRGEPLKGQLAVAEVTINRTAHANWPNTICGVVYERCSFEWTCNSDLYISDSQAYYRARQVAKLALFNVEYEPVMPGALFFHADYVSPNWSMVYNVLGVIGGHIFYYP